MNARTQITMDPELQRRAQAKAAQLGISFAEYVRRAVADSLGKPRARADISMVFDLIDEGPVTDVARDKDKMIADAVWDDHRRSVGHRPPRRAGSKPPR